MSSAKLLAVGDTGFLLENPDVLKDSIPTLKKGDLRFAQVERVYSNLGAKVDWTRRYPLRGLPEMVKTYADANFDVVSFASNHSMDYGPVAALDAIANFRKVGIDVIGIGANIAEARKPIILERNGVTIAFLGYCSVVSSGLNLPSGYYATETSAGNAPLRARTYYEQYDFHPATPPRIFSVCEEDDLAKMVEDIKAVRSKADVVVVSQHWGVHHLPGYVAHYQVQAAHAAIDAGCDIILGHHPHILKGVEVYKGKPIIYSLGNFSNGTGLEKLEKTGPKIDRASYHYDLDYGPKLKYHFLQYQPLSVIAEAAFDKLGGVRLQFTPVYCVDNLRPQPVKANTPKFEEIVEFLKWNSERFNTNFEVKEDHLVVIS